MARSARRHHIMLAVLAASVWPVDVVASPPSVEVDLSYRAPAGCPTHDEVLEQLRARVDPSWHSGLDPRRFAIAIERLPAGTFSGRLEVTRSGRAPQVRALTAESCRAVSAALVVFIAIALDPATVAEEEAESATTLPSPPPPPSPEEPTPSARPNATTPKLPPPRVRRRRPSTAWIWSSAVGVTYQQAPGGAFGARVEGQLARRFEGHRVAPAVRLSWGVSEFETTPPNGGLASFRFVSGRASACALFDLEPAPLTLSPCLGLDVGSLGAKSRFIPRAGETSTSWSALSASGRLSWALLPWLSLEGEVGFLAPFTRPTFGLTEPDRIVYRAPSILFSSGAGLAVSALFP
jgi:hypothetical protein